MPRSYTSLNLTTKDYTMGPVHRSSCPASTNTNETATKPVYDASNDDFDPDSDDESDEEECISPLDLNEPIDKNVRKRFSHINFNTPARTTRVAYSSSSPQPRAPKDLLFPTHTITGYALPVPAQGTKKRKRSTQTPTHNVEDAAKDNSNGGDPRPNHDTTAGVPIHQNDPSLRSQDEPQDRAQPKISFLTLYRNSGREAESERRQKEEERRRRR